jgi:proteasome lid subunit RPN8/RPN11
MALRVRQHAIDQMVAHARAEAPNECCGLLLAADALVTDAVAARNLRRSPSRFQIDPADHFAAIRRARETSRDIVGAYHSHPRGPSVPSATDAEELNDPTLAHVIVSLATEPPSVRAFEWADGNFMAIDLVPVP